MEGVEEANLGRFLQWATALGISDSSDSGSASAACIGRSLRVSDFPEAGGRGLAAARSLKKGELLLMVPKAALMTSDCLISSDQKLSAALGKFQLLSSSQILCIALLNEVNKGRSSWWYPYLKQLPRSYDLLSSFAQFEIEVLQIDDAIWTAEKTVHKAKTEWREAAPVLSELNLKPQFTTFNAWLWVSATISSRTMHVSWDTAGCLCPVGDFFNYAPPEEGHHLWGQSKDTDIDSCLRITSFDEGERSHHSTKELVDTKTDRLTDAGYDEALASYCFYAKRNYERGDQVLLSYGTYTNLELLEHYGFILQENPNDKAFVTLETEMYSLSSWPNDSLYISVDGKPSFALLSTVRLWATPVSKRRSVKQIACSGQLISIENEVTVMEWLAKRCEEVLSSCSTSIDEDGQLLHVINKIVDCNGDAESSSYSSLALHDEVRAFLKIYSVDTGKLPAKTRRAVSRWKLGVEWRHRYKRVLSDCISHCSTTLHNLSSI